MSQPKGKTNFRTYEASTRLLAAVIATTNVKLDYNEIAKHVGGGVGVDAINHRFRPIKQLAKMQVASVKKGEDPGDLPTEKGEIQKLFGESTPSGIEWQFRDIKSLGRAQQAAVNKGENPATVLAPGTPSAGRGRGRPAATPGSGATAKTPGTGTGTRGRKRKAPAALPPLESSDENGGADDNDSDFGVIETPSNRPSKRVAPASARKAETTPIATPSFTAANSTPTHAMTPALTATPVPRRASIFGGDAHAQGPSIMQSTEPFGSGGDIQMSSSGHDGDFPDWNLHPVAKPVKKEYAVSANTFLAAVNHGGFDGDYEDGEV